MALMKIYEYQQRFTPKSRPTSATVKRWISKKTIYGKKLGRTWYVDPDRDVSANCEDTTPLPSVDNVHPLAAKVLQS